MDEKFQEIYEEILKSIKIVSIGKTTKEEIEKEGLKVDIIPKTPSFEDIIRQL